MDELKLKMVKKPIPKKRNVVEVSFVNVTGVEIDEDIDSTIDIKAFQHLIGKITRERTPLPIPKSILPPIDMEPKSKPKPSSKPCMRQSFEVGPNSKLKLQTSNRDELN